MTDSTPVEIDGALVAFDPLILKGDTGPAGAEGPVGPAAQPYSLNIGTVATLPSGQTSSASITGDAPNQTLNLQIVQPDFDPLDPALSTTYVAGRPCSLTGVDGLPEPTGVGMEFVIGADGLDDIRYNGASL